MIRWLHISDLHLGSTDFSTDELRDELVGFLIKEGLKCDYVFCTGDIKTAGPDDKGFTDDMAAYLQDMHEKQRPHNEVHADEAVEQHSEVERNSQQHH